MLRQADQIIKDVLDSNKQIRNITSIERGRLALDFIRMNEEPRDFVLHNRYFEMKPQLVESYTSSDG